MKEFEHRFKAYIVESSKGIYKKEGFRGFAKHWLDAGGIEPNYSSADGRDLEELRRDLNTKAGLIISNHPSSNSIDSPLILNTIERSDLKIVASGMGIKNYEGFFDNEELIAVSKNFTTEQFKNFIQTAVGHIQKGGVVLLYPGGAQPPGDAFQFKRGFSSIVKRLDPQTMVYEFNISTQDIDRIAKKRNFLSAGRTIGAIVSQRLNPNRLIDKASIGVKEHYSEASEWQSIIDQGDASDRDDLLTKHYFQHFE